MAANWKYDERQRQIEKERIREEILAEEIARRRILEDEVRRELMLEKKIPFRPLEHYPASFGCCCRISQFLSPDQSRIACKSNQFYESRMGSPSPSPPIGRSIGLQELPLQCHPDLASAATPSVVSNGIQPPPSQAMAMEARIETKIAGQKRKSPIREADQEWNNENSTKKPKGWNCMLCNVITTSEIDLNRHRKGRKHKAKEAGLIVDPERGCDASATAVAKECNSSNQADLCSNGDTPVKAMPSANSSEKTTLWCDLCKVGATCPKDMASHEVGKKHLAKLRREKDALLKETRKVDANVVVTTRDNGSRVVVDYERDANTAKVSNCDPGVKITLRANGKTSENVVGPAKDGNSNGNGDTPGLHTTPMCAKSEEEIMSSSELCRVGEASSSSPTKPLPMEKVANGSRVVVAFEGDANTAMVRTCDPGDVVVEAKDVGSNGNGDAAEPKTMLLSAKSQEEIMFSSELCRVLAAYSPSPTKPLPVEKVANGSRVVVAFEGDANTAMVRTCDPGDVVVEAKDVYSNVNGDAAEPKTMPLSAKSQEEIMFSSELCRVLAASSSSPTKPFPVEKVASGSHMVPGVKMTFRADGKQSENVVGEAKDVDSNGNGGTSEPKTMLLSAKSQEEIMFSSELCRVLAPCSSSPTKPLPAEKNAEDTEVGNAMPKELTKEAEKEVMQVEQESNVIPSEAEKTAKNTIDTMSRGNANCTPCPLSATIERGLDEHKQGRKGKAKEAGLAVQKTVTRKGDGRRSKKKVSANSCEKFKLWYQMSQIETPSVEALHYNKLYDESSLLPDVSWFIEEVAQEVKDEDVVPKGAKDTGKVALQDQ